MVFPGPDQRGGGFAHRTPVSVFLRRWGRPSYPSPLKMTGGNCAGRVC